MTLPDALSEAITNAARMVKLRADSQGEREGEGRLSDDVEAYARDIEDEVARAFTEAVTPPALPPGYMSALICIHVAKTDLYLNGRPAGEIKGDMLIVPPKVRAVHLRETPFESVAALKAALHAAVDAITIEAVSEGHRETGR